MSRFVKTALLAMLPFVAISCGEETAKTSFSGTSNRMTARDLPQMPAQMSEKDPQIKIESEKDFQVKVANVGETPLTRDCVFLGNRVKAGTKIDFESFDAAVAESECIPKKNKLYCDGEDGSVKDEISRQLPPWGSDSSKLVLECRVRDRRSCDKVAHGQSESKMVWNKQVQRPGEAACQQVSIQRSCSDGVWSGWSGTGFPSCENLSQVTARISRSTSRAGNTNCVSIASNGGTAIALQCLQGEGKRGAAESRTLTLWRTFPNTFTLANNNGGKFCVNVYDNGNRLIVGLEDGSDNDFNDYLIEVVTDGQATFQNTAYPSCSPYGIGDGSF